MTTDYQRRTAPPTPAAPRERPVAAREGARVVRRSDGAAGTFVADVVGPAGCTVAVRYDGGRVHASDEAAFKRAHVREERR